MSDSCGNSVTIRGGFYVTEGVGPVIQTEAQSRTTVSTADTLSQLEEWINTKGGAQVANVNDQGSPLPVVWSNAYTGTYDGCVLELAFTFQAADQCNRLVSTTARFRIVDNVAPRIVAPVTNPVFEDDGSGNMMDIAAWVARQGGANAEEDQGQIPLVLEQLNQSRITFQEQAREGPQVVWNSKVGTLHITLCDLFRQVHHPHHHHHHHHSNMSTTTITTTTITWCFHFNPNTNLLYQSSLQFVRL